MVDWIQSPWTQPFGRRDLDEDPPRLVDLPFAFSDADAFLARSSAAVFSLAMVAGEMREGKWCGGESEHAEQGGRKQRERGRMLRRSTKILAGHVYKVPSEWLTCGPGRSNHIWEQLWRLDTWRKRRRGDRGVYAPSHPNAAVCPASRAPPNFAPRRIREQQISLSDAVFPAIRRSEIVEARKITRHKNRMDRVDRRQIAPCQRRDSLIQNSAQLERKG